MNRRLITFFLAGLLPIILLGVLFPEKIARGPTTVENLKYTRHPGADIVVFVRDGCPHCADFFEFATAEGWAVDYHEVTNIDTQKLFEKLQERVPTLQQGVPTIVLDGRVFQGYDTHETSGETLKKIYETCGNSSKGCVTYEDFLAGTLPVEVERAGAACTENCELDEEKYTLNLWIFGKVDLLVLSLPALAVLLGLLDGFNPCAMWVLITLLTLLINTKDWRKVWVIGGTFLFVSGAVYYLFIAAWLNVFLLIGYNLWVQKVIGTVAILGGSFYLYEAIGKDPNVCRVSNYAGRQRTIARMMTILEKTKWPAMIASVAVLAISVNMIELVCTAGLPAVFTQILAFNDVSNLARYGLIGLFILMYMLDDFAIFAIAVFTLRATGITTKYRRFTLIFGGLLMYVLGILLIFFPNALTFG